MPEIATIDGISSRNVSPKTATERPNGMPRKRRHEERREHHRGAGQREHVQVHHGRLGRRLRRDRRDLQHLVVEHRQRRRQRR